MRRSPSQALAPHILTHRIPHKFALPSPQKRAIGTSAARLATLQIARWQELIRLLA